MPRTTTPGLPEGLDVVQRDGLTADLLVAWIGCFNAGKMNQRVEQHRSMTAGEHEAIAVGPHGLFRIVAKYALPQRVSRGRGSHRRTRMSGIRLLDGINRKGADSVDRQLIDIVARKCACLLWNHSRETSSIIYFVAVVFVPD